MYVCDFMFYFSTFMNNLHSKEFITQMPAGLCNLFIPQRINLCIVFTEHHIFVYFESSLQVTFATLACKLYDCSVLECIQLMIRRERPHKYYKCENLIFGMCNWLGRPGTHLADIHLSYGDIPMFVLCIHWTVECISVPVFNFQTMHIHKSM